MIHHSAIIDSSAELDPDVTIGPYSVIGKDVRIKSGTWVAPHVVINGPCTIGHDNKIYQFASIGEIPQDKKYRGGSTELIIGNRNTIREFCTINRGTEIDRGQTSIGNDNWIMAYVHIAHDCVVGSNTVFANGASLAGHVVIEDYAVLGGFTLIHQFCRVGEYAFCGMGTALSRDLPPFIMASGNPARTCGLNKEGLKRYAFSDEVVQALHRVYMILVKSRTERENHLQQLKPLCDRFAQVNQLVEFIENSERGITR